MGSPVLYRIECVAANQQGCPQYVHRERPLACEHERVAASTTKFENEAQMAVSNAGYETFTHYSEEDGVNDPSPLVFYALKLDGKAGDLRGVLNTTFGIPTKNCIAIEHLILLGDGMM